MATGRPFSRGPDARPVAVPDDVDHPRWHKATGRVELPPHVRWSGPPKVYDLDDPIDRNRVYEQVLREGTDDDIRHFIDTDTLAANLDDLVLPARVRAAWTVWFRRRGVQRSC